MTSVPPYRRSLVTTQPSGSTIGAPDSITTTSRPQRARAGPANRRSRRAGRTARGRTPVAARDAATRAARPARVDGLVAQPDGGQVRPHGLDGVGSRSTKVAEAAPRGQRLDPERAAPAEQVDHREPSTPPWEPEDVEDRLAHPVRGRTHRRRELGRQPPTTAPASDDPHRGHGRRRASALEEVLPLVLAQEAAGSRRPGRGAPRAAGPRRRWPRRPGGPRREDARSSGSDSDARRRSLCPFWRAPSSVPSPRSAQVLLGQGEAVASCAATARSAARRPPRPPSR